MNAARVPRALSGVAKHYANVVANQGVALQVAAGEIHARWLIRS